MRHSDRKLTDIDYPDENLLGTSAAIDALPDHSAPASQIDSQILVSASASVAFTVTTNEPGQIYQTLVNVDECHSLAQLVTGESELGKWRE